MSLNGKVVAITRPEKQAREMAKLVSQLGGKPYIAPTIEIRPLRNIRPIKEFANRVLHGQIDFVIFMSVNGVISLIESLEKLELKADFLRELNRATVIAVGPKTKRELGDKGIEADLVPPKYSSKGVVERLSDMDLQRKTVAIPRSSKANTCLRRELEKMGANVFEFSVYESAPPSDESKVLMLLNDLLGGKISAITFTSASTVQNLFKIAEEHALTDKLRKCLKKTIVAAIGPVTQSALKELRINVDVVPKEYTIKSMMEALAHHKCAQM